MPESLAHTSLCRKFADAHFDTVYVTAVHIVALWVASLKKIQWPQNSKNLQGLAVV